MAIALDTISSSTPNSAWCRTIEEDPGTLAISVTPLGDTETILQPYLAKTVSNPSWMADLMGRCGITHHPNAPEGTASADVCGLPAKRAIAAIHELTTLDQGWDGRNAVPVLAGVAASAIGFVRQLPPDQLEGMRSVPFADGRIQLEWDKEQRSLEIEFSSSSEVHYLKWDPDYGIEDEGRVSPVAFVNLNGLVNWFFHG